MKRGNVLSSEVNCVAAAAVKSIEGFITEFEAAKTLPESVYMSKYVLEAINKKFPYLIEEQKRYNNGKYSLRIILLYDIESLEVGVNFCFSTDSVLDTYNGS
ncbi:hypothetical protein DRN75_04355 [Nanoarchaeota archaeon]|nr:MAG: hypothetical protein DRN75_04355 [Nanoarchaeota archaeon]